MKLLRFNMRRGDVIYINPAHIVGVRLCEKEIHDSSKRYCVAIYTSDEDSGVSGILHEDKKQAEQELNLILAVLDAV